ncbi:hypothetical protein [Cohnella boryungensis]|uniref:Site-specific integrase n=1 Tax=Cohnella boryungensis TaxID=768479 RepID=A0ABV8SFF3_9BACL
MNFLESASKFIAYKQESFIQVQGYEKDLLVFDKFLKSKKVNDETWSHFLGGANTELVIDSLKFYIQSSNGKVNAISTANRFVSVLVEYFQYAIEVQHISNKELYEEMNAPIYSDRSFRSRINSWISNNLKDKESIRVFSEVEIIDLIKDCNETLGMLLNDDDDFDKKFVPALILKLIIFTGIKYRIVPRLKVQSFNIRYGTIDINNFTIHLPYKLIDQLDKYLSIRNKKSSSDFLFIKSNGEELSEKTSNTAYFLGSLTTRTDLTGIIKYAVVQMINKGINTSIISEFTGVGTTILEDCMKITNKDIFNERNALLDSRLRESNVYQFL